MTVNVLIVDDSLTVRMDLVDAFATAGFETKPCATLAEARNVLGCEAIAIVVLDVVLPDGDGIDFLREIRGETAHAGLPVLMLTSEAEVRDRVRALTTGADDYVGKPYDRGYVIARTQELLRTRDAVAANQPRVLIIDDSVTFRELLREHLARAGYGVLVAETGEAGLRIAAQERPTAVIVDGVLPGIDGPTVIRHLRLDAALRGTPCVLMTASDDRGAELRALDAGATAFVRKDQDLDIVIARLAAAIRTTPLVAGDAASGRSRILAIAGDPVVALLRLDGYDVVLARSPDQVFERLAVETVDCIVLDLAGIELCRQLKAAPIVRDLPLVLFAPREDRDLTLEALAAGADDCVARTSEPAVIEARIRAQVRRKHFEDETRQIRERLLRSAFEASEARVARQLAEARAALAGELERKNQELEAFSYSVSHDLRAPLRSIEGFAAALFDDYGPQLDDNAQDFLRRIRTSVDRMSALIDDLLELARVTKAELVRTDVDLAAIARTVIAGLRERDPDRRVEVTIDDRIMVAADPGLLRAVLENLLGNAWKFSARRELATIAVHGDGKIITVRDNGVGFEPSRAEVLFRPFHRLHTSAQFEGSGVGLATVHRIVSRHGGRIWLEGAPDLGATVFFTLGPED